MILGVRSAKCWFSRDLHHVEVFEEIEKWQEIITRLKSGYGAADEFRANSKLKSSEYSVPVLGLIFLRYVILGEICLRSLLDLLRVFTKKARKG